MRGSIANFNYFVTSDNLGCIEHFNINNSMKLKGSNIIGCQRKHKQQLLVD